MRPRRFGGGKGWSDANFALFKQMPTFEAQQIFVPDWGIVNAQLTLSKSRLPLRWLGEGFVSNQPSAIAEHDVLETFATKNSIWVSHTPENEMFAGVNARLEKMASAAGYQKIELSQVVDRNHQPVFEIFRIVPRPGPVSPSNATISAIPPRL